MDFFDFGNNQNKSQLKNSNLSSLPPINVSKELTYSNNHQIFNIQRQFSSKIKKDRLISLQSTPVSELSSLISSNSTSSIDSHTNSYQTPNHQSQKQVAKQQQNDSKIQSYEGHGEYKHKTVLQIMQEIKQMRSQFVSMNTKLSEMLDSYSIAKTQFVPKQLLTPSKAEFYKVQIETNKKVQHAQILELKKLNEIQFEVKDKDILLDLQKVLIQMRESLHHAKKQQHDFILKNHKQDVILDEIIKVNNDNKDNNAVKLLKLQIVYYMRKQNSLKIHQEQLQHQEKLILQNDKHLDLKIEEMKKSNKNYFLFNQNYQKMKEKYNNLKQKKNNIKKQIDTLRKAREINEEKYAREFITMDNQHRIVIKPKTIKCDQENKKLQNKINSLMQTYQLKDKNLKEISYKFSHQLINKKTEQTKKYSMSILKPDLRSKSNLSNDGYLSARVNEAKSSQSNEKVLLTQRYNDKNISMTIDVNFQNDPRLRSFSEATSNINVKPRNFRLMTKKNKEKDLTLDKIQPYSMTIDHLSSANFEGNFAIQRPKMLKPKLLIGTAKR